MAENSNNSTNNDILSGKGLEPIPSLQTPFDTSGITIEKRGEDCSGLRIDQFTKDSDGENK